MVRTEQDLADIEEAIRHCRAALKALQAARATADAGALYPTYLHISAVEMAHATERTLQVALRNR
jgi:hypothetical protein